jgi:hypothetical protein
LLDAICKSNANIPQYHTTQGYKCLTTQKTYSYDGMADFYVKKYEDFEAAYKDPFYVDVVRKDEQHLFDIDSMLVTIGVELTVINDHEKVEGNAVAY